jgi:hypothetical protein
MSLDVQKPVPPKLIGRETAFPFLQRPRFAQRAATAPAFAVAFSERPVLSSSGVAASCLRKPPLCRWRRQRLGKRTAANSPGHGRVYWIDRLQIIQLSRGRRPEAQPVCYLEPAGFSHQGICGFAQFAIGTDRRRPRNRRGAVERALHCVSFAAAICRIQPAWAHRASRRRRFV